tara:strand:- start:1229 stop:2725 length:1497 start_codon:yes stop_codon:yes gene_type:complete
MDAIFFSKENYQVIYKIINQEMKKKYGRAIVDDMDNKKIIVNIMKYVFSKRTIFNIPENLSNINVSRYLSQKTVKIFMLYEEDNLQEQTHVQPQSPATPASTLSMRPSMISKQGSREELESRLKDNVSSRKVLSKHAEIDFREKSNENPANIQDKYEEISKIRQAEYEAIKASNESPELNRQSYLEQPEMEQPDSTGMEPDAVDMDSLLLNMGSGTHVEVQQTLPHALSTIIERDEQPLEHFQGISTSTIAMNELDTPHGVPAPSNSVDNLENIIDTLVNNEQFKKIDDIVSLLENNNLHNDMSRLETNLSQIFYAIKDHNDYKTLSHSVIVSARNDSASIATSIVTDPSKFKVIFGAIDTPEYNNNPNIINIRHTLKNVISIKLIRIMTKGVTNDGGAFLFLKIDEYNSNVISNTNINEIFSKVRLDNGHTTSTWNHWVNDDPDIKTFKTPIPSLESLTMELVTCDDCGISCPAIDYVFEICTVENYKNPGRHVSPL